MAGSLIAKSKLAVSNIEVTNFVFTATTLWHSGRLAKLDHKLFRSRRERIVSKWMGGKIELFDAQSIQDAR